MPKRKKFHEAVLIVIPTFNEVSNIGGTIELLQRLGLNNILIVDDSSPDGTGELVSQMSRRDPRVQLISRPSKSGLASAYTRGFGEALQQGFEIVAQMDADGSHRPEDLLRLIRELQETHVGCVIGSRWVPNASVKDWSHGRMWLSKSANFFVSKLLGFRVQDSTSGIRAYRSEALSQVLKTEVSVKGFVFQVAMTQAMADNRIPVSEVPITFLERQAGYSKMSLSILIEAAIFLSVRILRKK